MSGLFTIPVVTSLRDVSSWILGLVTNWSYVVAFRIFDKFYKQLGNIKEKAIQVDAIDMPMR